MPGEFEKTLTEGTRLGANELNDDTLSDLPEPQTSEERNLLLMLKLKEAGLSVLEESSIDDDEILLYRRYRVDEDLVHRVPGKQINFYEPLEQNIDALISEKNATWVISEKGLFIMINRLNNHNFFMIEGLFSKVEKYKEIYREMLKRVSKRDRRAQECEIFVMTLENHCGSIFYMPNGFGSPLFREHLRPMYKEFEDASKKKDKEKRGKPLTDKEIWEIMTGSTSMES